MNVNKEGIVVLATGIGVDMVEMDVGDLERGRRNDPGAGERYEVAWLPLVRVICI